MQPSCAALAITLNNRGDACSHRRAAAVAGGAACDEERDASGDRPSRAKAVYLHDLAERLSDGRLDLERLQNLDDDAARLELMQVKGVGRFTADGVLMLALRRPDVWPAADLALRRTVERVWGLDPPASVADVDAIGERFRPWRTLAAGYLYRSGRRATQPASD